MLGSQVICSGIALFMGHPWTSTTSKPLPQPRSQRAKNDKKAMQGDVSRLSDVYVQTHMRRSMRTYDTFTTTCCKRETTSKVQAHRQVSITR